MIAKMAGRQLRLPRHDAGISRHTEAVDYDAMYEANEIGIRRDCLCPEMSADKPDR